MIYWDHNATTPCAPEVVEAMRPYWNEDFGNPASAHLLGHRAAAAVRKARAEVAGLMNCRSGEIAFTSGATESNNLLFLGILLAPKSERRRIVVSAIEHKSVLEPARLLAEHGFEVVKLPVNRNGVVELEAARERIDAQTLIVSVQAANNELGSLQPVTELAEISHVNGAYFHTDAAQMLGKLPFDLEEIDCDFASFSAHKLYGPKGVGALFVRGGVRNWPWARPLGGGGQEMGLRPGTSNVPAIVGFGEACRMAGLTINNRISTLRRLTEKFINGLNEYAIDATTINDTTKSIPGTISLLIHGVPSDVLIAQCNAINISKGSACNNGVPGPSYVLSEVLQDKPQLDSVVRVSFGVDSLAEDFHVFFDLIREIKKGGNHE